MTQLTRAVPDVPGLQPYCSTAQSEAICPLPTAPPPGLKQLFRVVVPADGIKISKPVVDTAERRGGTLANCTKKKAQNLGNLVDS